MKLSAHFTLEELTISEVAARNGLDNTPDVTEREHLYWLCNAILEPLRDRVRAPIVVTSGYRSEEVNRWVGGAKNSDHQHGNAADIICPGLAQRELFDLVRFSELPFYQCIDEFGAWVHVSFHPGAAVPLRQVLRAIKRKKAGVDYVAV